MRRDTYKYKVVENGQTVYFGVTNDLVRRESEHQERFPASHLVKIGRRTFRAAALKWIWLQTENEETT